MSSMGVTEDELDAVLELLSSTPTPSSKPRTGGRRAAPEPEQDAAGSDFYANLGRAAAADDAGTRSSSGRSGRSSSRRAAEPEAAGEADQDLPPSSRPTTSRGRAAPSVSNDMDDMEDDLFAGLGALGGRPKTSSGSRPATAAARSPPPLRPRERSRPSSSTSAEAVAAADEGASAAPAAATTPRPSTSRGRSSSGRASASASKSKRDTSLFDDDDDDLMGLLDEGPSRSQKKTTKPSQGKSGSDGNSYLSSFGDDSGRARRQRSVNFASEDDGGLDDSGGGGGYMPSGISSGGRRRGRGAMPGAGKPATPLFDFDISPAQTPQPSSRSDPFDATPASQTKTSTTSSSAATVPSSTATPSSRSTDTRRQQQRQEKGGRSRLTRSGPSPDILDKDAPAEEILPPMSEDNFLDTSADKSAALPDRSTSPLSLPPRPPTASSQLSVTPDLADRGDAEPAARPTTASGAGGDVLPWEAPLSRPSTASTSTRRAPPSASSVSAAPPPSADGSRLASEVQELKTKLKVAEDERDELRRLLTRERSSHERELKELAARHERELKDMQGSLSRREDMTRGESMGQIERLQQALRQSEEQMRLARESATSLHRAEIDAVKVAAREEQAQLRREHDIELKRLETEHREALEAQRVRHEKEIANMMSTEANSRSLGEVIETVKLSAREIEALQSKLDSTRTEEIRERERVLEAHRAQVAEREKLVQQQADQLDRDRTKLQESFARIEVELRAQRQGEEQSKWRLTQESQRLQAQSEVFEKERSHFLDQIARERVDIQAARESLAEERRAMLEECQEQRRQLAQERAELTAQRRSDEKERRKLADKKSSMEAEMEVTLSNLRRETGELELRWEEYRRQKALLQKSQTEFQRDKDACEEEKAHLSALGSTLALKSAEIVALFEGAQREREEAQRAKAELESLSMTLASERLVAEDRIRDLEGREKQIQQQRLALAAERSAAHTRGSPAAKRRVDPLPAADAQTRRQAAMAVGAQPVSPVSSPTRATRRPLSPKASVAPRRLASTSNNGAGGENPVQRAQERMRLWNAQLDRDLQQMVQPAPLLV